MVEKSPSFAVQTHLHCEVKATPVNTVLVVHKLYHHTFILAFKISRKLSIIHTSFIRVLKEGVFGLATSFLFTSVSVDLGGTGFESSSGQLILRSLSVNLRIRFRDGFMMPSQFRG